MSRIQVKRAQTKIIVRFIQLIIFRFANVEMVVTAVEILSRFKIIAMDKENLVKPVYGFITKPEKEVWIHLQAD